MSGRERARVKFMYALQGQAGLCVRCNDNRSGFCGECMEKQSALRVAVAEATITKEAYERGVAEERERIEAMPCYGEWADGKFCLRDDFDKDLCPRCAAIRARTPSPACETAGEEE